MIPEHLSKAIYEYLPAMEGWTSPERGCEMAELILDNKPEVVVELGVFAGRSLVAQAFALRENHGGKIYGVDSWRMTDVEEGEIEQNKEWWGKKVDLELMHRLTMRAIWSHRLEEFIVVVRAPSQFAVELFSQPIDILNIDGNHSEIASCRDVRLYLPRVRKGGFIYFDDCDWESTKKAQSLMEQSCDTVKVSPDGHYKLYKKR